MAPSRDSHPASLPTLGRMAAQRLELTLAMTSNPRSDPVLRGAFQPDGVAFRTTVSSAPDIFWRQLHAQEFDASEMSMSSLLIVLGQGNRIGLACRSSPSATSSRPGPGSAPTPASTSPRTSRASASASPSTSRPLRSGPAASSSTTSASPRPRWTGTWSARRTAPTAPLPASALQKASASSTSRPTNRSAT